MAFWTEVFAIFVGDVFASVLLVVLYMAVQWFLRATDVKVSYSWGSEGADYSPNFDIRNRSGSRTYLLANVAYTKNNGKEVVWFDNESLWGQELKPRSARHDFRVAPVRNTTTPQQALALEVTVRLQNGRSFWLKGQGPGQLRMGRMQRSAFWLRDKFEKAAIPLE
jgi:hypothetical protein